MKETLTQTLFAAALGAVAAYFHVLMIPLCVMIAVMLLDYISGMAAAWSQKTLNSRCGVMGIIKKVGYIALVAVGIAVDYLITSALINVGISLQVNYCFGMIVTIWLIINELISILENLKRLGIPLPDFLVKIVSRLKNNVEDKTKED
ncbi:MAG: phage holin family protein [Ruminococcus sp.]|nr:phage holin family protein [uncultured Ruminococcus sp.]MBQ1350298.1 phage holin family protein [Ruminococcus sp.]MBQ4170642.1 phage holin family protein [Ruminococcus sp.]MBQ4260245.1 phage holin family protein [Ruminococcus sp.]SCX19921.1 toxin secretion/phage lysis holin [Ruminococcaceae bacterium P7]